MKIRLETEEIEAACVEWVQRTLLGYAGDAVATVQTHDMGGRPDVHVEVEVGAPKR